MMLERYAYLNIETHSFGLINNYTAKEITINMKEQEIAIYTPEGVDWIFNKGGLTIRFGKDDYKFFPGGYSFTLMILDNSCNLFINLDELGERIYTFKCTGLITVT